MFRKAFAKSFRTWPILRATFLYSWRPASFWRCRSWSPSNTRTGSAGPWPRLPPVWASTASSGSSTSAAARLKASRTPSRVRGAGRLSPAGSKPTSASARQCTTSSSKALRSTSSRTPSPAACPGTRRSASRRWWARGRCPPRWRWPCSRCSDSPGPRHSGPSRGSSSARGRRSASASGGAAGLKRPLHRQPERVHLLAEVGGHAVDAVADDCRGDEHDYHYQQAEVEKVFVDKALVVVGEPLHHLQAGLQDVDEGCLALIEPLGELDRVAIHPLPQRLHELLQVGGGVRLGVPVLAAGRAALPPAGSRERLVHVSQQGLELGDFAVLYLGYLLQPVVQRVEPRVEVQDRLGEQVGQVVYALEDLARLLVGGANALVIRGESGRRPVQVPELETMVLVEGGDDAVDIHPRVHPERAGNARLTGRAGVGQLDHALRDMRFQVVEFRAKRLVVCLPAVLVQGFLLGWHRLNRRRNQTLFTFPGRRQNQHPPGLTCGSWCRGLWRTSRCRR